MNAAPWGMNVSLNKSQRGLRLPLIDMFLIRLKGFRVGTSMWASSVLTCKSKLGGGGGRVWRVLKLRHDPILV